MLKAKTLIAEGYEIEQLIAEGGMGEIYLAHKQGGDFSQKFALKKVKRDFCKELEIQEKFQREAEFLCSIEHPNIVKAYACLKHKGENFLLMDYLTGKTLRDLYGGLKNRSLSERCVLILEMARCLCSVMTAIQARLAENFQDKAFIHGDISPQNFMIDTSGTIKCLDFGAAIFPNDKFDDSQSLQANSAYMAPERALGQRPQSASDTYSSALIFLEIYLAKALPRGSNEQALTLAKRSQEIFTSLGALIEREEVLSFFQKALHPLPQQRYHTFNELYEAVQKLWHEQKKAQAQKIFADLVMHAQAMPAYTPREKPQIFILPLTTFFLVSITYVLICAVRALDPGPADDMSCEVREKKTSPSALPAAQED
jgi:serine/threonine protein kinase